MTRYADTLLAEGERMVLRTRQHWFATIVDGRVPWAIFLASLVVLALTLTMDPGGVRDTVGIVVAVVLVGSLVWLGKHYWSWLSQDYIVTNRRVLKVEGIINKRSADSSLEKINDAVLEQNLFGRIFGYGDLDILTANEQSVDRYRMLSQAQTFKRTMLEEKHKLEQDVFQIPAPPLRAPSAASSMAPAASMSQPATSPAPVSTAPPAGPRQMSSDEITAALGNLADLRDRGAISAEDLEAKKQDLLSRL